MRGEGNIGGKLLLICLLLCSVIAAQTASLAAEQETHHSSQHCCALCHAGPMAVVSSAIATIVAPSFVPVWIAPAEASTLPREVLPTGAPPRAPPA